MLAKTQIVKQNQRHRKQIGVVTKAWEEEVG